VTRTTLLEWNRERSENFMNNGEIEEKFSDVMQNIEAVVADAYRTDDSMSDYSVMSVMEALINIYSAEMTGHTGRPVKLSPQEQILVGDVKNICEWRLGRGSLDNILEEPGLEVGKKTIEEILIVLKRLLKSVKFWNREGGRQGYLNYIVQFL
jgi:hypothetical protein